MNLQKPLNLFQNINCVNCNKRKLKSDFVPIEYKYIINDFEKRERLEN